VGVARFIASVQKDDYGNQGTVQFLQGDIPEVRICGFN
jgi:hypothetical protein